MVKKNQSKSELTRQRILEAAAKVVGEIGYARASISKITDAADLASGGFYYYFKTREALFDELLPSLGHRMLEFISENLKGAGWGVERETRAFETYLVFLSSNPEFYRVFSEAYVYAPNAYKTHFSFVVSNYCDALRIQKAKGHIDVAEEDVELLAYFLIGIRNYVSQMYMENARGILDDLPRITLLYRRMIEESVFRPGPQGSVLWKTAALPQRPA